MKRPLLALSLLVTGACSMQMRAESSASGNGSATGTGSGSAAETPPPAPEPKSDDKKGGVGFSASFHKEGSFKIDWQGRSGRVCRSSAPFKFVGMAKASGSAQLKDGQATASGSAEASGKSSGGSAPGECNAPRTKVPPTPPAKPVTHPEKPEPTKPEKAKPKFVEDSKAPPVKPKSGEDSKAPPAKPKPKPDPTPEPPKPPVGPTPVELEKPIEPPAEPPDNEFGYDKPVLGCFEGQVFPLAAETKKLPANYESLTPVSVVYACEWDIPARAWDKGFPGIADRFEWFAIRYHGAFRIADAGDYDFRVSSDDGVKISIDGKLVLDNDGVHPPKEGRGKVKLGAGDHQMVLEYFQGPRFHINLQVWVTPPGKPEELFTVR